MKAQIEHLIDALDEIRERYVYCDFGEGATARHHHERINNLLASVEQKRASFPTEDAYYASEDAWRDLRALQALLAEYKEKESP